MSVSTLRWDGDGRQLEQAAALYGRVFAEPPYGEDLGANHTMLREHVTTSHGVVPGFRLELAWCGREVVGLVMTRSLAPGDAWWDTAVARLPESVGQRWLGEGCLCVNELAVAADHRRQGVGAALMSAVLGGTGHRTAVLACDPAATNARAFYERRGWTGIGVVSFEHVPYDVLATRLR